eukprot:6198854-Alexandrium_andersonii.AAC.1
MHTQLVGSSSEHHGDAAHSQPTAPTSCSTGAASASSEGLNPGGGSEGPCMSGAPLPSEPSHSGAGADDPRAM